MKHRVGRQRAARIDPSSAQFRYGRPDHLDLLAAETASLAGVRIEPGDRQDRRSEAEILAQRRVRYASGVDNARGGQAFDRLAQGDVDGHRDNPQSRTHQHHDRGLVSLRELGEVFGMARMMKPRAVEALLVDRVRDERGGATAANVTHADLDRAEDGWSIGRVRSGGSGMNGPADREDWKRRCEDGRRTRRSVDRTDWNLPAELPS